MATTTTDPIYNAMMNQVYAQIHTHGGIVIKSGSPRATVEEARKDAQRFLKWRALKPTDNVTISTLGGAEVEKVRVGEPRKP